MSTIMLYVYASGKFIRVIWMSDEDNDKKNILKGEKNDIWMWGLDRAPSFRQ